MNKDKILAEIAELFEPKWGYNTKEQWLKLVADILTAHEQEGMNHTTADKILTDMFESGWFHQDQIDYFEKEIINSLVSEPEKPYNSDPHEWSEGEHRYFLTTHALRWLPEPTRFVNETDNEIAKRVLIEYCKQFQGRYSPDGGFRGGAWYGWDT